MHIVTNTVEREEMKEALSYKLKFNGQGRRRIKQRPPTQPEIEDAKRRFFANGGVIRKPDYDNGPEAA